MIFVRGMQYSKLLGGIHKLASLPLRKDFLRLLRRSQIRLNQQLNWSYIRICIWKILLIKLN